MSQQNNKHIERRVRRSYYVSTISISLVLFLLGSVGYLILNAVSATNTMRESVSIFVMLDDTLSQGGISSIGEKFASHSHVAKSKFVSKEDAANDFKEYVGKDFVEFLEHNPLPNSFEVSLKAASTQRETVLAFEKEIASWSGVNEVVYQRSVVEQISSNLNKFNLIILVFGGALFFISMILLNNTIRVTVLSKRYIINTMKMVGASRWFILRPFVARSFLQGIYAGIISSAMFFGMIAGINEKLPELKFTTQNEQMIQIMVAMGVLGVLISVIFTTFVVRKFIRMRTNTMYLY